MVAAPRTPRPVRLICGHEEPEVGPSVIEVDDQGVEICAICTRLDDLMERRRREVEALQSSFSEKAACHRQLNAAGVPPGELAWRIAWLVARSRA